MNAQKEIFENVTLEQLIEFFGGKIEEKNGEKVWIAPQTFIEHPDYLYKLIGSFLDNHSITVVRINK